MKDGPNIVGIAALIGDHARADVLSALLADRAMTPTELAAIAGVTKQTISAHLTKLLCAGLIAVERQGRHRYFRLADDDVAELLESLMGVAYRTGAHRLVPSPRDPALRKARICYDHLAGELGVRIFEALLRRKVLQQTDDQIELLDAGRVFFGTLEIDVDALAKQRRVLCRACLDWSERRSHLAGGLGAALLTRLLALGWAKRVPNSRVVRFTPTGEGALDTLLDGTPRRSTRLAP